MEQKTTTKEMIREDIDRIDTFISTPSFQVTDAQMDTAMAKWNIVFDKYLNRCENNEITQMGLDNERSKEGLRMKAEVTTTEDGKQKSKYTDKTLEMALDGIYFVTDQERVVSKYFKQVLPNKIKVLEHKINFVKKIKGAV